MPVSRLHWIHQDSREKRGGSVRCGAYHVMLHLPWCSLFPSFEVLTERQMKCSGTFPQSSIGFSSYSILLSLALSYSSAMLLHVAGQILQIPSCNDNVGFQGHHFGAPQLWTSYRGASQRTAVTLVRRCSNN